MNKSEQAKRYFEWKKFQNEHSEDLLEFATKMGFAEKRAPLEFILAEAFSRVLGIKVIRKNYIDADIYPMPLYWHFDFLVVDGEGNERGVEVKFRLNDSDEYPTDNISISKKDYNAAVSDTIPIDLYNIFYDGKVRVYDLNGKSEVGEWTHSSTTAVDGAKITDKSLSFNPTNILWTTSITMPDEFAE